MFLIFAGSRYYPLGGMNDMRGKVDSLEEAIDTCKGSNAEWWHIVNADTFEIVESYQELSPL